MKTWKRNVRIGAGVLCLLGFWGGAVRAGADEISIDWAGRTVFQRMETNVHMTIRIENTGETSLEGLRARIEDGTPLPELFSLPDIAAGETVRVDIPVDTRLRPGVYPISLQVEGRSGSTPVMMSADGEVMLTPRPAPFMPVKVWGHVDEETMQEIGFTHSLRWMVDHTHVWDAGEPVIPYRDGERLDDTLRGLDSRLAAGVRDVANIRPGSWVVSEGRGVEERRAIYNRVNRAGETHGRDNVCGLFPEIQQFSWNVGASIGQTFGSHPALDGAMINTERRDGSRPCFHEHDMAAYRAYSGQDIPEEITSRRGISADRRGAFVSPNGLVDEDNPILSYYRWFWTVGDGWNELHSQAHRGLKTGTHPGFWTFFDPAVRCPPIWGSGGEVDVISQWTYTYPETPRIGLATDELFAMAEGRPGQEVMKMTQIIWYRSRTAPDLPEREEDRADWEREEPEARFITIAPDHLREAFWLKLARPVQGIMYHGINSLVGGLGHGSYRYTNPESREVLTGLIHDVVRPLGPALLRIPDSTHDVAMLESFTSMMFGAEGTWGWGRGWPTDVHQMAQWARLQPRIVYEDTILRDGLDGISILIMPSCPVLPRAVAELILAFQERGGIVVGDPDLAPAIVPDILVRNPTGSDQPHERKDALQAVAEELRAQLMPVYDWPADSSDPDALVRLREYGDTAYLFVINDKRTYGDYVGHHRRVMEQGVDHEPTVFAARPGDVVYDLLTGQGVETRGSAAGEEWTVSLGPGEGRIFMITPRPIAAVRTTIGSRSDSGRSVEVQVRVVDRDEQPLNAVIPVHVDIRDPAGESAEFSGYYGAEGGTLDIHLDLAENDIPGEWIVRVREMASNNAVETRFAYRH